MNLKDRSVHVVFFVATAASLVLVSRSRARSASRDEALVEVLAQRGLSARAADVRWFDGSRSIWSAITGGARAVAQHGLALCRELPELEHRVADRNQQRQRHEREPEQHEAE